MSDHEPPTSLDKPLPGDDHADIPMRVAKLEVMVEGVILRLDKLDAKIDRLDHKLDAGLEKLNDKIDLGLEKLNEKIDLGLEKLNDKIDLGLEKLNDKIDAGLEKLNDKIDAGLEKLNDKVSHDISKLNDKIDANREATFKQFEALNARFDRFYHLLFMFLTAMIAGLLGLLAKVLGVI